MVTAGVGVSIGKLLLQSLIASFARSDVLFWPSSLMASNSLVLKSTIFPEWYADRVQPWVQ